MIGGRPAVAEVLAAARATQESRGWRAERMLLSLVLHTYSMRYLLPSVLLLGSAPTYMLAWTLWRVLSALLPARLYQRVDDRLYCVYQNMVLFFFENYTGVQVRRGRAVRAGPAARAALLAARRARAAAPGLPPRGKFLVLTSGFLLWLSVFPGPPHPRPGRLLTVCLGACQSRALSPRW